MRIRRLYFFFPLVFSVFALLLGGYLLREGRTARAAALYTNVSGHITADTVWTQAGSPYILTGDVIVDSGATLAIEAGVVVQGRSNTELQVQGRLLAVGTATQPITFTSETDSGPGQWRGLVFAGGTGNLEHVLVRYGGSSNNSQGYKSNLTIQDVSSGTVRIVESAVVHGAYGGSGMGDYGIRIADGRAVFSNTLIAFNGNDLNVDYGLYATGSNVLTVTGCTFASNSGSAVRVGAKDFQGINDNTFSGNGYDEIRIDGGNVASASLMGPQTGLKGYVVWTGNLTVPDDAALRLDPGVKVLVNGGEILVRGIFSATGTAGSPITLTSYVDNNPGGWNGIVFDGGNGWLRHVTVRYGGRDRNSLGLRGNLFLDNASRLEMVSSRSISESYGSSVGDYGIYICDSEAVFSDTLIAGNGTDLNVDKAFYVTGNSQVTVRNSVVENNGGYGVYLDGGTTSFLCSVAANNRNDGIYLENDAEAVIRSSSMYGNDALGLNNATGTTLTATYNWWGAADGPSGAGSGSGDGVSADVEYAPWLPYETCVADLGLVSSASPNPVSTLSPVTYTLRVDNYGPAAAASLRLTDTLPAEMTFVSAQATQGGCQHTSGVVTCTLGSLQEGGALTVSVVVNPTAVGTFTATAQVADERDLITANNTSSTSVRVLYNGADPVLAPARSGAAAPTGAVIYTHTLTNLGNVAQSFDLTALSSQGFTVTVNPAHTASVPPSGSVPFSLTVQIPPNVLSDTQDTATITAVGTVGGEGSLQDVTTVAFNQEAPTLTPAERVGAAAPAQRVVYTHTLINHGNAAQTFDLTALSSQGFPVALAPEHTSPVPAFGSTVITVTVVIPPGTPPETQDTVTLTAAAALGGTATAEEHTTVLYVIYLPLSMR